MKNTEITNKVRATIGIGRIDEVFDLLEGSPEIWVNADSRDIILQLKANYSILKNKSIKGTISSEGYNTELNVIIDNLLSFLKSVDEVIDYHEFQLQSGELKQENLKVLVVPKYLGAKNIWKKIKIFFSRTPNKRFSLFLVKTQQYWIIDCPEHLEVQSLTKYIADSLFPNLKEQHFIWKLETGNIRISNLGTVQNSRIPTNQPLNLTAEYKHHDELWGDNLKRKIVMQDFKVPSNKMENQIK